MEELVEAAQNAHKNAESSKVIGTPFQPGNPGKAKGTTNILTRTVKETVLAVFNDIQADPKANLKAFAKKYPRDFYAIAARLIPTEITGSIRQVIVVTDQQEDQLEGDMQDHTQGKSEDEPG